MNERLKVRDHKSSIQLRKRDKHPRTHSHESAVMTSAFHWQWKPNEGLLPLTEMSMSWHSKLIQTERAIEREFRASFGSFICYTARGDRRRGGRCFFFFLNMNFHCQPVVPLRRIHSKTFSMALIYSRMDRKTQWSVAIGIRKLKFFRIRKLKARQWMIYLPIRRQDNVASDYMVDKSVVK